MKNNLLQNLCPDFVLISELIGVIYNSSVQFSLIIYNEIVFNFTFSFHDGKHVQGFQLSHRHDQGKRASAVVDCWNLVLLELSLIVSKK